ncbi:NlpC/P60 family protein [Amycolatopsis sp. cmx-8-4]|uniref:NlpC/P60 family protein n=1 Tax=Amycolatopsis sp. cmx-8-4 TaxID=2790947 RepID=UPI00397D097E
MLAIDMTRIERRSMVKSRSRLILLLRTVATLVVTLAMLATPALPASANQVGDRIGIANLASGDWPQSANGTYRLSMQTDGNLVLYGPQGALWATYTNGNPSAYLANQGDGNLVIYRSDRSVAWASRSRSTGGGTLVMQNDGNVVAAGGAGPFWSTYTGGGVDKMAAAAAVAYARAQVGKAYVYGAEGPNSFDCSGLTKTAYAAGGVSLPHSSQSQYTLGWSIGRTDLQPGDLVFYYGPSPSHVAIYVGNDEVIQALNHNTGVRYDTVAYAGVPLGYRRYR